MTFPFRSPASFIHRVGFLLRLFRNIASDVLGPGRQMGAFRSGGRAVRPARSPFTWPTPRKLRQSVRHLLPFSAPWHCLIWERECFLRRTRAHDPARRCRFLFVFPRALRYAACRARRSEPCDRNAVFPSLNNPRRDGYCQSIKDKFPQVSYFDSFGFLYRTLSLSLSLPLLVIVLRRSLHSACIVRGSSCAIRRLSFSRGRRLLAGRGTRRFGAIRAPYRPHRSTNARCARPLLARSNFCARTRH